MKIQNAFYTLLAIKNEKGELFLQKKSKVHPS